jgi:hypothetical protein
MLAVLLAVTSASLPFAGGGSHHKGALVYRATAVGGRVLAGAGRRCHRRWPLVRRAGPSTAGSIAQVDAHDAY